MQWPFQKKERFVRPLPAGNVITNKTKKALVLWKILALFSFGLAIAGWTIVFFLLYKEMTDSL